MEVLLKFLNNQLESIKKIIDEVAIKGNVDGILDKMSTSDLLPKKEQVMKFQGKTIHKNKNSDTWYSRFRMFGKQYYVSGKTQKECYSNLKKSIAQTKKQGKLVVEQPIEPTKPTITLLEWYKQWLELYKVNQVKQATIDDYAKSLTYVPVKILESNITEIKAMQILKMLNNISAERTRQKVYELLYMVFDKAMKNEIIEKNIIANIDKPKHEKENSQPLTREQEQKFIQACKQVEHGDYFLLCLYQGLRKGECLAITDQDIDFTNKTINKSINDKNKIDTTKNKQSNWVIPIFDDAIKILENYKDVQGRIFNICPKTQRIALNKINELLDFHVKTKDLRSTFITRCQEMGIPEYVIQSWVGHRIGSKVTSSVYTKYNEQDNVQYIEQYNQAKFYSNSTHFQPKINN